MREMIVETMLAILFLLSTESISWIWWNHVENVTFLAICLPIQTVSIKSFEWVIQSGMKWMLTFLLFLSIFYVSISFMLDSQFKIQSHIQFLIISFNLVKFPSIWMFVQLNGKICFLLRIQMMAYYENSAAKNRANITLKLMRIQFL